LCIWISLHLFECLERFALDTHDRSLAGWLAVDSDGLPPDVERRLEHAQDVTVAALVLTLALEPRLEARRERVHGDLLLLELLQELRIVACRVLDELQHAVPEPHLLHLQLHRPLREL